MTQADKYELHRLRDALQREADAAQALGGGRGVSVSLDEARDVLMFLEMLADYEADMDAERKVVDEAVKDSVRRLNEAIEKLEAIL